MATWFHTLNDLLQHVNWWTEEKTYKRRAGDGSYYHVMRCPVHNSKDRALIIRQVGSKVSLNCTAGCKQRHLLDALYLRPQDLYLGVTEFKYPIVQGISVTFECVDNLGNLRYQQVFYSPKEYELRQSVGFVQKAHDIDFTAINDWLLKDWGFEIYDIDASKKINDYDDE